MEENINNIVKEESKKISDKQQENILNSLILILIFFSSFTAITFGVYLLPQVIEISETAKNCSWVFAIGILGFVMLPGLFLIKHMNKKEKTK